jgi:hypothetical protein
MPNYPARANFNRKLQIPLETGQPALTITVMTKAPGAEYCIETVQAGD